MNIVCHTPFMWCLYILKPDLDEGRARNPYSCVPQLVYSALVSAGGGLRIEILITICTCRLSITKQILGYQFQIYPWLYIQNCECFVGYIH
jgi:hypothetical protein